MSKVRNQSQTKYESLLNNYQMKMA